MIDLKRLDWGNWLLLAVYGGLAVIELMTMNTSAALGFLLSFIWYALFASAEKRVADLEAKLGPTSEHEHV